ncbi:MAG: aminomethyltransferase family protein, partial [Clostridia bacterium]|nr:aminomethyltransferase family protein [Clostridia bacterium]
VIGMYAVQGPKSMDMLNSMLETPIDDIKRFRMADNKIGDLPVRIHRSGFTGENGSEVYVRREELPQLHDLLEKASEKFDARELKTLEVYVRSLPMEKGMALKQDMQGLTPSEAGLGWSVHMDKDFHGKEALAAYEDQYKLVGIVLDEGRESYEDIAQNEPICHKGVQCGIVRQMIYGYTVEKNIGFAIVDKKFAVPGTVLTAGPNFAKVTVAEDKKFLD